MNIGFLVRFPSTFPTGVKPTFIVVGAIFCLTIIGIVPGAVLIAFGATLKKKVCPVCKNEFLYSSGMKAFTCIYCQKRLLLKNGVLTRLK